MAEPALEARGLTRRFGALAANEDVSLTLLPGECHAVIGPNGAGKSTLVAMLAGEQRPDAGRVLFGGDDVTTLGAAARARRGISRSFQITQLCRDLTVRENVMLAVQAAEGRHWRFLAAARSDRSLTEPADAALAAAGLSARAGLPAALLSHGEQRQLELAIALAQAPRVLLLDEPAAGLGAAETPALAARLAALKGRVAMLLVEHDMDTVFALADRITVLAGGRVIASGTPAAIRSDRAVREAYLGDIVDA
jgi:branched-chain amino acid transport system ATP-binding protein